MSFSSRRYESLLLGAHFSIAGGLDNALYEEKSYHCNTLQIFTKNAMTWKERTPSLREINLFEQAKEKTGIEKITSHASYLINLATKDKKKHAMSTQGLKLEFIRSSMLGISYVVLHPGSHMGIGEKKGINLIADSITRFFQKPRT